MLQDDSYEHLVELTINLNNYSLDEYLYCLCSRTILSFRNDHEEEKCFSDVLDSGTFEDASTVRFLNSSVESQTSAVHIKKKEQDDGVSCYCSASHCSTDDSTREAPHSDSGADLSETSKDPSWEDYWAKNGENIIWHSWIKKYGEYIDPSYTKDSKQSSVEALETLNEISHDNSEVTRLSFCSEISDSLTNVTPLTLSELSAEDSSLLSSSDSGGSVSTDVAQWQALWQEHFNSQYSLAYEKYKSVLKNPMEQELEICETSVEIKDSLSPVGIISKRSGLGVNSVGHLLNHLRSIKMAEEDSRMEVNHSKSGFESIEINSRMSHTTDSYLNNEPILVQDMVIQADFREEASSSRAKLKRPHEREDDKLRGAFSLIGLSYHGEGVSSGLVYYKKRNIRLQNRMLNMHIHFDEDGQIMRKDNKSDRKVADEKWYLANTCEIKSDFSEKDDSSEGEFYSASEENESKKEKRKKKKKRKGLPKEITENEKLLKFWYQRYRLFSKFDEGIKLDEESWYSVSPEKVSQHTAERCRCDLIIDACCGAGGNTIQFAFTCERVIAVDIDPHKIELARHNAKIYGVEDRIEFIVGDFVQLAPFLQADVVFLSPPWGGLGYSSQHSYNLDKILPPLGGSKLFELAAGITPNVAMFLPRNVNMDELLLLAGPGGSLEVEQNFLGKKLIAVTAYFGELVGSYTSNT